MGTAGQNHPHTHLALNRPLGFQPGQRAAHNRPADFEQLAEFALRGEPIAHFYSVAQDIAHNHLIDLIRKRFSGKGIED